MPQLLLVEQGLACSAAGSWVQTHVSSSFKGCSDACPVLAGYIQVLARAVGILLAGAVSPLTLAGIAAAYAVLVLAAVYITELELRLPLVHYKTPYVQVWRLVTSVLFGQASRSALLCALLPKKSRNGLLAQVTSCGCSEAALMRCVMLNGCDMLFPNVIVRRCQEATAICAVLSGNSHWLCPNGSPLAGA